jgi:putative nucleotidyltransferase with HDIG domain
MAIADFVDLKSPYTLGHSRSVADLAAAAAGELGGDVESIRRAGLVHDLGRMGVANTIWDRAPLTAGEVERVRLHPYYTDRILVSVPALARLAPIAAPHHERLDGSGYPRGTTADSPTLEGRLLAVTDCYQAWSEPRPYRDALPADAVASRLRRRSTRAGLTVPPSTCAPRSWSPGPTESRVAGRTHRARNLRYCDTSPAECRSRKSPSAW